jgi:predicted glycosyltransferase
MGKRFDGIFCHGARSAFPAAHVLRIPLIVLGDYEHTAFPRFMCRWVRLLLTPDIIPADVLVRRGFRAEQIRGYPGLKEDLYVHGFEPDPSFFEDMGIDRKKKLVLLRPPATMAHYAVVESEVLFFKVLDYLCGSSDVELLLLPRTNEQREELIAYARQKSYTNLRFPAVVYNGPNLIWNSDLVISGGGTMNREAASLGIPVVSIYQGPIGAVDSHLIESGRLTHVKSLAEMKKVKLEKFSRRSSTRRHKIGLQVRDFLVDKILRATMEGKHGCEPLKY